MKGGTLIEASSNQSDEHNKCYYVFAFLVAAVVDEAFLSACCDTHFCANSFNIINVAASMLLISISISFSSSYSYTYIYT
jgi:hypothetical protein